MGIYLNPRNVSFQQMINNPIYVDKSLLINYTNSLIGIKDCKICVSRPRRFGKSTDADMLVAYYSKGCDSSDIFDNLKISKTDNYKEHLNKHNVIYLNMQKFLSRTKDIFKFIDYLTSSVLDELLEIYEVRIGKYVFLADILDKIHSKYNVCFIFIIDEWDCIFREYKKNEDAQEKYLDFLRDLLKDQSYVELAYMTGILPIKKYGSHSALNMFDEISMISPKKLTHFMGFTEDEVKNLCIQYQINFEDLQTWYDGYHLNHISLYSPRSVVASLTNGYLENYWNDTETYEALQIYIDMNFDGLKDDIIKLLNNEKIDIDAGSFQNDMTTFKSKDDVLTLLVHLGYLGYDRVNKKVYIPNKEVTDSFIQSIKNSNWQETTKALKNSKALLEATWNEDEEAVARYIEEAHLDTSILTYNNENALSYTISLAYITARNYYTVIRELPSGKGYADIAFIPYKDKPAMIVELKWNKEADTAISQIKAKKYPKVLENYIDNLLLVGISYDKDTKKHNCVIEKYNVK